MQMRFMGLDVILPDAILLGLVYCCSYTRSSKKCAGYLLSNNVLKSLQKLITLVETIFCV